MLARKGRARDMKPLGIPKYAIFADELSLQLSILCERIHKDSYTVSVIRATEIMHVNGIADPSRTTVLKAFELLVKESQMHFVDKKYNCYDRYLWVFRPEKGK